MKKNKSKSKKTSILDKVLGAMLMVIVGIMPLVARATIRTLPPELLVYFSELAFPGGMYVDIFAYWKSIFVLVPAVVIVFFVVSEWVTRGKLPKFKEVLKLPPVFISLAYLGLVIISAIASAYTRTAWLGTFMRGEGALMWLAYFVVFFAAVYFARRLENTKWILYGLAFSSVLMGAIGISQLVGRDFFETGFAGWLVTGVWGGVYTVFEIAHGTLFNPNTFGKYSAMVAPVLLLAALTYDGKKWVNVIFLVAGSFMLVSVFASSSLGGLIGIVTAVFVLVVTYLCRPGIPRKRLAIAAGSVVAALVLAVLFVPPLNYRVNFLFGRLGEAMRADTAALQNYIFEENTMTVYGPDGKILSLEVHGFTGDWLTVRCGAGEIIEPAGHEAPPLPQADEGGAVVLEMETYTFIIPGYRTVAISKFPDEFYREFPDAIPYAFRYHHRRGEPFWLTLHEGRIYGTTSLDIFDNMRLIDLHNPPPAWGFAGRETWGSSRGYIWSRSFPLMFTARSLTVGYGPDAFINAFPTYDPVSHQRYFNTPYKIVDKAHNIVIQTWISTGALSAIALLALFGHYLITTFISLVKSKGEPLFSYGLRLGLLCGVSAYVMSSMATDTTIGSTGVFFVLLGIGYGLNLSRREPAPENFD